MNLMESHSQKFAACAAANIDAYLGIQTLEISVPTTQSRLQSGREVHFSLHYTGSVYGEYVISMDETVARSLVGESTDSEIPIPESEACDALLEILNVSAGESIAELQKNYSRLTITAPRVTIGQVRYPNFQSASIQLTTSVGEIQCFFCLDTMRLDLSTSYEEAMETLVDVNEQLRTANQALQQQQTQLVHTEKMASLGVLASGVAHEINNPLFFIESNLNTLEEYIEVIETTFRLYEQLATSIHPKSKTDPNQVEKIESNRADEDFDFVLDDTKELMSETVQGVHRIKTVVQGLRDFAPMDRNEMNEFDVTSVLQTAVDLVKEQIPDEAKLNCSISRLPPIRCNPPELGQVFSGILLNAVEAIGKAGTIDVEAGSTDSGVIISISDDGIGIAPKILPMLLDPFYSTKAQQGHAGLGLSIAHGIVKNHGGQLRIKNRETGGAKVTIEIPSQTSLATDHLLSETQSLEIATP